MSLLDGNYFESKNCRLKGYIVIGVDCSFTGSDGIFHRMIFEQTLNKDADDLVS